MGVIVSCDMVFPCEMGNGSCFDFISGPSLFLVDSGPVQRGVYFECWGF